MNDTDTKKVIDKLNEAINLGDSSHKGPFGTFIRKEYLVNAIKEIERLQNEVDRLHKENFWLSRKRCE